MQEQQFQQTMHFFRQLAFPRAAGSEGELQAQTILRETFNTCPNVKLEEQDFTVSRVYMAGVLNYIHPIIGLLILIAIWIAFQPNYLFTLIFAIFLTVLAIFSRQIIWALQFPSQQWGHKIHTKNFIATVEPSKEPRQTLVFLAHYDSISHVLSPVTEAIGYLAGFLLSFLFGIHAILFAGFAMIRGTPLGSAQCLFWGIPVAAITFLELFNAKGNASKGVADDASGVAQMFHLIKGLEATPLGHTKVIFVATGAEELGDSGAEQYIAKYKASLPKENTRFIVVDSIGIKGNSSVIYGIGLPLKHFSPYLEAAVREEMLHTPAPLTFQAIPPLLQVASDHVPVTRAGYEFIWFASTSFVFHTEKDSWNCMDEQHFREVIEFIEKVVRRIEAKAD